MKSWKRAEVSQRAEKRRFQTVDNEQDPNGDGVKPQLGASGFSAWNYFVVQVT